jgi:hypothetical protein
VWVARVFIVIVFREVDVDYFWHSGTCFVGVARV